jgi:SAM-dependent methyltransferase
MRASVRPRSALALAACFLASGISLTARPVPPADPARPALPASPARPAQSPSSKKPKARLFQPQDLGLLEAPDRELWQKPDQIMDSLLIAEGSVVADLGAGGGWFTIRLARRVGPNGLVYAEDIQPEMIEAIGRRLQREGLQNVRTVLGTPANPRLPSGIDAVLIVDAYHEMDDPVMVLRNVARSLKLQGRLGIAGFNPGGGGPGPAPDERVDPQSMITAAEAAGLQLLTREPVPPFQFLLVFGRSTSHQSAGRQPAATSSFSTSAITNGVKPTARAPRMPSGSVSESHANPPAKTIARPHAIAITDGK